MIIITIICAQNFHIRKAIEKKWRISELSPIQKSRCLCDVIFKIQLFCVTYGTTNFYFNIEYMDFLKEIFINYLYVLLNIFI